MTAGCAKTQNVIAPYTSPPVNVAPPSNIPQSFELAVPKLQQAMTSWCWAAVSQMVLSYQGINVDQRELVEAANGLPLGYCASYPPQCNVAGTIDQIRFLLATFGRRNSVVSPTLTPDQLLNELKSNRPVIAFLKTTPFVGHFVVVKGIKIDATSTVVNVNDPFFFFVGDMLYSYFIGYWTMSVLSG